MKTDDNIFDYPLLKRSSPRPHFLMMCGSLTGGIAAGAAAVKLFNLPGNQTLPPLFYSAFPVMGAGFLQCFSDILLNIMIFLIAIFLLGATAFGALGIPLLIFYRGVTVSMGALFLMADGDISTLGRCAICFTPLWAAASLLLVLFATRAMVFSKGLARAGFSQPQETVDFRLYLKDFIYFLCFSVPMSVVGALLAAAYALFY